MPDDDVPHSAGPVPTVGGIGHTHTGGPGQKRGFTRRERWFAAVMMILAVVLGGGALLSQQLQQNSFVDSQRQQATAEERKLCSVLLPLAALRAPAGDPTGNPSRAYEQNLEAKLSELAPAVGCK